MLNQPKCWSSIEILRTLHIKNAISPYPMCSFVLTQSKMTMDFSCQECILKREKGAWEDEEEMGALETDDHSLFIHNWLRSWALSPGVLQNELSRVRLWERKGERRINICLCISRCGWEDKQNALRTLRVALNVIVKLLMEYRWKDQCHQHSWLCILRGWRKGRGKGDIAEVRVGRGRRVFSSLSRG